jgi:hypothetical protein
MTTMRYAWTPALVATALVLGMPACASAQVVEPSPDSAAVAFAERVDSYAQLRNRFEEPLPSFARSRGAWSTLIARQRLASAIRAARRDTRVGSVFSPPVALMFRQHLAAALTPAERLLLGGGEDGESVAPIPMVNETVRVEWMAEAPPALLQQLPELPAAIEYRFVGNDLILWDAHAEIVIDVLSDALR